MTENDISLRLRLLQLKEFLSGSKQAEKAIQGVRDAQGRLRDEHGRFVGEANKSTSAMDRFHGSVRKLKGSLPGLAFGLGAATTGIAAYAVKQAAALEQVTMSYETLLQSQSAAQTMVTDLRKFARDTPFEFTDVTTAGRTLLAFGANAKSIIPILTALGDASSGLGLGGDGIQRLSVVFGQIASKGTLQGDEALQLAEAGIPVYDMLAKSMRLSPGEVRRLGEQGRLASSQVIPVILQGMSDRFGGLMAKQSKTLGGTFSNLKDTVTQALTDAVTPYVPQITSWLQEVIDEMPTIASHTRDAVQWLFRVADGARAFYNRLVDLSHTPGAVRLIDDIGDGAAAIAATVGGLLSPFGQFVSWMMSDTSTSTISNTLDHIAAFCENPFVQDFFGGVAVYATAMWGFSSATRAAAASMGILKASMAFLGVGGGAAAAGGATAGGAAGASRFGGLGIIIGQLYVLRQVDDEFHRDWDASWASFRRGDWLRGIGQGAGGLLEALFVTPFKTGGGITKSLASDIGDWFGHVAYEVFTPHSSWGKAMSDGIEGTFRWIGDRVTGFFADRLNWIIDQINGVMSVTVMGQSIGPSIGHVGGAPGAARGGELTSSGLVKVGEAGQEILALPRGAKIYPNRRAADAGGDHAGGGGCNHPIYLDAQKVGEVMCAQADRRMARL